MFSWNITAAHSLLSRQTTKRHGRPSKFTLLSFLVVNLTLHCRSVPFRYCPLLSSPSFLFVCFLVLMLVFFSLCVYHCVHHQTPCH
ncbi:hypothetical protein BKA57DRAFT_453246, partial [Linnemannia elongata]